MTNGILITKTEYNSLVSKVERLEKTMSLIVDKLEKIFEKEPKYGTEKWWRWSINKSEEEYAKGNYRTFESAGDLQKYLDHLK